MLLRDWLLPANHDTLKNIAFPPVLLLDGGVSTELEKKLSSSSSEAPAFVHRELWSSSLLLKAEGRAAVRKCHEDFLSAGVDIISTCTYQAHYMPLPGRDKDDDFRKSSLRLEDSVVDTMLRDGVRLAREAIAKSGRNENSAYIAASIGSLGGALADGSEYTGRFGLSVEQLAEFHRRKVRTLASEKPDLLAFETIPCLAECEAILILLEELANDDRMETPPAWLSLACSDGAHLNDGSMLMNAVAKIDEMDPGAKLVHAVGINCCSLTNVQALLERVVAQMLQSGILRTIVCYPNSGEEWNASTETWVQGTGVTSPKAFADGIVSSVHYVRAMLRGKRYPIPIILGGCCRTTLETTRSMRRRIDSLNVN